MVADTRILFLLGVNQVGGAERTMLTIARGLQADGFRVQVAAYGRRVDLLRPHAEGLELIDLATARSVFALWPLCRLLRQTPAVMVAALRYTNLLALAASTLTGTRCIITEHSPLNYRSDGKQRHLMRLFYPCASAIIAVSQGIAAELRALLPRGTAVECIYNPAVPEVIPVLPPPGHPWLQAKTMPVLMAVGRLSAEKDFATLLRAFALLRTQRPARLIMLGDGDERPALEALAAHLGIAADVSFTGIVHDIYRWLRQADLFVSSSRYEGFGNAIVEALACGVKVVATDCPVGPAEILQQGRFGRLVPVGDAEAMAQAMAAALDQPADTAAAQARARQFSDTRCLAAYRALIERMVTTPRFSLTQRLCRKAASILLHEQWMIGWIDAPIEASLTWRACPPVHWLGERGKDCYLADPFAWPGEAQTLLCEQYDFRTRQGSIRRITWRDTHIESDELVAFPLHGHLSYPFLFEHAGAVYCLPESSAAHQLSLFRWQDGKWELIATPLPGVAAADSILFAHEERFWIAYTDIGLHPFDNLNLCYAMSLTGPWTPHPKNPVVRGLAYARCGGTPFRVDGQLYRPAQDCSQTYGGAIRLMRIEVCTPTEYRETEVTRIVPEPGRNPHGLHTLSACGNICLVDGKRLLFSPRRVLSKIARRFYRRR